DVVVAATKDAILMIEAGGEEISEDDVMMAVAVGHEKIKELIKIQEELMVLAGKPKAKVEVYQPDQRIENFVREKATKQIEEALHISDRDRQTDQIRLILEEMQQKLEQNEELKAVVAERSFDCKKVIEKIQKEIVRRMILDEGKRPDGRSLKEIRPISCEVGVLPRAHGSAIFTRGQTQVLTVATLGSIGEVQKLEGLDLEEAKRYLHHYNFPAFSVGEVRPMRGPGRREIGHGALAERALLPVIPPESEFPYTIRLVSEVLGSNGSTSMASTCGSTLALMDAGVKIDAPVAGISIGLITQNGKAVTLTDIQGLEDHFGDMDFKVAGTRKGITAIQLDIKIKGLSYELIRQALEQAKEARLIILDKMNEVISTPRPDLSPYAPRVITFSIDPEKIGLVIGPAGKNIKKIIEETGVQIDIQDNGQVFITTPDPLAAKKAKSAIDALVFEPKVGDVFKVKIMRIVPFGAFVELPGGKDALIHISEIADRRIGRVEDYLSLGQEVIAKIIEIDELGRVNLTLKGVTEEDKKRIH
ncbi:MAG: polyribonucleotide nucleotidyltransferase, partial [Candidatus Margulisiibacteriota bacterium]